MEIIEQDKRKQWRCDGCGKIDFWGDEWSWYGSYKMLDDGEIEKIKVACSNDCKTKIPRT